MAKQYRLGWRPDYRDHRDLPFKVSRKAVAALPASNPRFAKYLPPIWDQKSLGSCTAHAILRLHAFAAAKAGLHYEPLSRLQLYYDERFDEGTVRSDAGAQIRTGIKSLVKRGVGLESLWPYNESRWDSRPTAPVYRSALDHQALKYESVAPILTQVKAALYAGFPVVFGFPCYQSMFTNAVERTGDIPIPGGRRDPDVGGHAVAFNGYWDDARQRIGFDNSWDVTWGRKGSGTLPYWYFANGMVSDCWVVTLVEGSK